MKRLAYQVVAKVHDESILAEEIASGEHGVCQAKGRLLANVFNLYIAAPARAITYGGANLEMCVADDNAYIADTGRHERLDRVEENRLVGKRQQLLGASIGKRAKSGTFAAAQNQAFHRSHSFCPARIMPLLDWRFTKPVIAYRRVIKGYPSFFLWIVGAGGNVKEVRGCLSNDAAPVRHSRGNLQHHGWEIISHLELLCHTASGRPFSGIVEGHSQSANRHIPPVNLRLMNMPRLDDARIHFRVA